MAELDLHISDLEAALKLEQLQVRAAGLSFPPHQNRAPSLVPPRTPGTEQKQE